MSTKRRISQSLCLLIGALSGLAGCSPGDPSSGDPSNDDPSTADPSSGGPSSGDPGAHPAHANGPAPTSSGGINAQPRGAATSSQKRLKKSLPLARVRTQGQRIQRLYGEVARGSSPDAAAENFLLAGAKDLGLRPDDLAPIAPRTAAAVVGAPGATATTGSAGLGLMFNPDTGTYKFRLYAYQQTRDNVPVYGGQLRTLVRVGGDNPVVWANTDLRPLGTFSASTPVSTDTVDAGKSLAVLAANPSVVGHGLQAPKAFKKLSDPTPTIFAGWQEQISAPRMALKYTAYDADSARSWTFVSDASTGDVLHVQSNQHYNIDGTVHAEVVAGVESMDCGVRAVEPLAHARVSSPLGDAITNVDGEFTIVESGGGTVTVVSNVTGEYFDVTDTSGTPSSLSLSVAPPGPATFVHQDLASQPEIVLAQVNAYKHANALRDLLIAHVPDYPVISTELGFQVNVNASGDTPMDLCAQTGGAWYDGDRTPASINFCTRTTDRANTSMGSIIHHEYGHHIVDAGGSKQAEYGEGMSDTIAMLFTKDPAIGLGYRLDCQEPLRQANNDCQYSESDCSSCGPGIYQCGALISGTVWDIWQELQDTVPTDADDLIRSLVFSSIPMHTGTSIDPSLAIDMLTLDDDDSLLENGTPHYQEICTGFGLHNMDCPPIVDGLVVQGEDLQAGGPSDGPFEPGSVSYTLHNLGPEETLSYSVQVPPSATWLTVDDPTGSVALGEQTTVTISIDQAEAAALPNGRHTTAIDFINLETGVGNVSRAASLRVGVPEPIYTATFDDGLEGFVVDQSDYDNIWHQTTACVDALPGHSSPGSLYYGRDDQCNHSTSVPNRHWVTSPTIPIANPAVVDLGFNYYLRTERPGSDILEISMSVNGGPFEVVAGNGEVGYFLDETTAWEQARFEISDRLPTSGPVTIQLQLAFDAGSPGDNNETGFLIDDLVVYAGTESSGGVGVPARIEAEHYVRSYDTTASNQGGGCETGDDVDKEVTGDSAGGGCNVGWTDAGEWLEYDISVATAQTFDFTARVASQNAGKTFRIEVDGVDVTGPLSVPANGWQNYSDVVAEGVPLSAGDHVVRVFFITNYININYLDIQVSGAEGGCGDGMCSSSEDCTSCSYDCGNCNTGCTCPSGCASVQSASTPFSRDGATDACYFISGSVSGYLNSWNMTRVNLNGVERTNVWVGSNDYPATINGGYYLYVDGDFGWSHVELN